MADALAWSGQDVSVAEIERRLVELRETSGNGAAPELRTSVMTHIAWVPTEWEEAATQVRTGLGARHPSRAIVLYPRSDQSDSRIDARVAIDMYGLAGLEQTVSAEVIELWLRGGRCVDPASIVAPLLMADLPVFLRWRGLPEFTRDAFQRLLDLVDRLIVNSAEWPDVPSSYRGLLDYFDDAACSDIVWRRTQPWRGALAQLWPGIADVKRLRVVGPAGEASLLAGWLCSRLDREIDLDYAPADGLEAVEVDGEAVEAPAHDDPSGSDLLSAELDVLERDRIYEAAVEAACDLAALAA
jgi:glucose-6-phosphate dehydrogenase assembly protein OpcA